MSFQKIDKIISGIKNYINEIEKQKDLSLDQKEALIKLAKQEAFKETQKVSIEGKIEIPNYINKEKVKEIVEKAKQETIVKENDTKLEDLENNDVKEKENKSFNDYFK